MPPRPTSIGTAGRLQSEWVADISRNHRPTSSECAACPARPPSLPGRRRIGSPPPWSRSAGPAFVARASHTAIKLSKVGTSWSCNHPQKARVFMGQARPPCILSLAQGLPRRAVGNAGAGGGEGRGIGVQGQHRLAIAAVERIGRQGMHHDPQGKLGLPGKGCLQACRPLRLQLGQQGWRRGRGPCPPAPARDGTASQCCRSLPRSSRPPPPCLPGSRRPAQA